MLKICQICLSTDREVSAVEESIHNWFDELCDFSIEDYAVYCKECAHLLKKFYNFKSRSLLANKILKKWKKCPKSIPLNKLKNKLPPSVLNHCNAKNHTVYYCNEESATKNKSKHTIHTVSQCSTSSSQSGLAIDIFPPNLDPDYINIAINDDYVPKDVKIIDQIASTSANDDTNTDVKKTETFVECNTKEFEDNTEIFFEETEVKIEHVTNDGVAYVDVDEKADIKTKSDSDDDSVNDIDCDNGSDDDVYIQNLVNSALKSDNSSDSETLLQKFKKLRRKRSKNEKNACSDSEEDDKPIKKKNKKKETGKRGLEQLKLKLSKYANEEVKDKEGNVIDLRGIANNLDKMHIYTYNKVRKFFSGKDPFDPESLQVLSMVNKRYGNQYDSVFVTEHLTTKEEIQKEFDKRMEHETYVNTEYKCTLCYRGFEYQKRLDYHIAEYHNPARAHGCDLCKMRFNNAQAVRKHIAAHRVVYKCKLCPLVTNYRTVMENHYNQHNGVKYPCLICNGQFRSKPCLAAHMNSMHQSQYICKYCARFFHSAYGLEQHRKRKHLNEPTTEGPETAKCDQCNITFISEEVYQKHLEKAHPQGFKTYWKTRKPNATLVRKKPSFVCRVCNIVEHSIGRLTLHFKTAHPNEKCEFISTATHKYLCHECGKRFLTSTDFKEHKFVHTGAKPYTCDQCPKSFHRKINLRNHLERHKPPSRECVHCGKKFISASNLSNHMKMHTGIRHYTCDLCSKGFLHRSALNAHVRGVHLHIRRMRKPPKELDATDGGHGTL